MWGVVSVVLCLLTAVHGIVEVTVAVAGPQPLQPFHDNGTPCANLKDHVCWGGAPAVAAVMANITGAYTMRLGVFEGRSRLVLAHPSSMAVNFDLQNTSHFDALVLHDADIPSTRLLSTVQSLNAHRTPVVATNLHLDDTFLRPYFTYSYVRRTAGGVVVAYLACLRDHSVSPHGVLKYVAYLRAVHGVTHVVLQLVGGVHKDASHYSTRDINVIIATTDAAYPSHTMIGGIWHVNVPSTPHRVDVVTLRFRGTALDSLSVVSHRTDHVAIAEVSAELRKVMQDAIDKSAAHDQLLTSSTAPMPSVDSCMWDECELATLLAEAMDRWQRLEVPSWRGEMVLVGTAGLGKGWDRGRVHTSHLFEAIPRPDTLCFANVTAAVIWRVLEGGLEFGGLVHTKGLKYGYNTNLPPGSRVTSMATQDRGVKWGEIDPRRVYRVTTTEALCSAIEHLGGSRGVSVHIDLWAVTELLLQSRSGYNPFVAGLLVRESGPPLRLAKKPADCGEGEVFNALYETCDPCYGRCLSSTDQLWVLVAVPLAAALVLAIGTCLCSRWWGYRKGRGEVEVDGPHKRAPKGGTVTLVFTDIQSSTQLWGMFPDDMSQALSLHHSIVRTLIEQHEGYEVKTIGDAFMVAFASSSLAVAFACRLQVALYNAEWPEAILSHPACQKDGLFNGLRVRMGIHTGVAEVKRTPTGGYDYEGNIVNVCSRVADSGNGGQIVITEEVFEEAEGDLEDVEVMYLGEFCFKGVTSPVGCLQVLPEELKERSFRPLRGVDPPSSPQARNPLLQQECPITPRSSLAGSISDEGRKEYINAMQSLRRVFASYGQHGPPLRYVGSLLTRGLESSTLPTSHLLTTLLCLGRDPASRSMSWKTFVALARQLPTRTVVAMSAGSETDLPNTPSTATRSGPDIP